MKRNGMLTFVFLFLMIFQNIYTTGISLQLTRRFPVGSYYDNGDGVNYQIKVINSGEENFSGDLEFLIGNLTTSLDGGGTGVVFNNIQNSGTPEGKLTNIGTFTQTGNLDVKGIFIPPGGSATYSVLGTINADVNGKIDAVAKLLSQGKLVSEKTDSMTRIGYDLEVNKIGPKFYEKGGEVTYDITVQNVGTSVIKGLDVRDMLDSTAFESSIITASTTDSLSSVGNYTNQGDLIATGLYITPGNTVTYRIQGRLNNNFIGTLQNSVDLTARKKTQTVAADPVPLAQYDYMVTKTSLNPDGKYSPGGSSTYRITITNNSKTVPITGMNLEDEISKITALDTYGNSVLAYDSNRIVTRASAESDSSAGRFSQTGDLRATGISIAPGKSIAYTITTYVKNSIVGEIKNNAVVTDRNGAIKNVEDSGIISQAPEIVIQKNTISNSEYLPGGQIGYTVNVKNIGSGIAYGFNIEDRVSSIISKLANASLGDSSADVDGNPIRSWTISAALSTGSTNSESDLVLNSGQIIDQDLNDTGVILYPGEGIEYSISMATKSTAIGDIVNTATAFGKSASATYVAQSTVAADSPAIKITKTTNQSQYEPGGTIEYLITVNNTDNSKFANNIEIKDLLSQIKSLDVYGVNVPAIQSWELSVQSQSGAGTTPGTFNYGATNPGSSDLIVLADLAPGGEVVYRLTVKVNDEITGKIFDNIPGDTVTEVGTGVAMAPYKLELSKYVDQTEYTPGQTLRYTVQVTNTGVGTAVNIPIKDIFSNIKTDLVTGVKGLAYTSTSVTAEIYNKDGSVSSSGPDNAGFKGILEDKNLDVSATISPGKKIIYTVVATINPYASGRITNTANVNSVLISDKGSISNQVHVNSSKSVQQGSYPNNIPQGGVMVGDEKIVYTIVVSNEKTSGFAMNIPVVDNISQITAKLLNGGIKPVFKADWEIDVKTEGVGTQVSGNPVENGKDINTRVNIAPGGKVIFTVTATIANTDTDVFYGSIVNSSDVDGIIHKATTSPKMPFLKIYKSSSNNNYVSGGIIDYTIEVVNVGSGYANDAKIEDVLSSVVDGAGNKAFSSWRIISAEALGTGTTTGTVKDNQNIDTTVDIAPNGGKVTYIVEAQLNDNLTGIIANTVSVLDVQNNNTSTASASTDNAQEDGTIFIRKTSDSPVIDPLSPFTYEISVKNNSVNMIKDIWIKDNLDDMKGQLANSGGSSTADITGDIFTSWKIYKDGTLISTGDKDALQDLIVTLKPQELVEYKIVAQPDPRILIQKVRNIAEVYNGTNVIETSYIENNILGSTGGIQRSVNLTRYKPGDTLVYTIKVAPNGSGYLNDFKIDEEINSLNVGLMNGSTGNVFFNPTTGKNEFTVQFVSNESKVSKGTIPIPSADVRDNENLVGTVDIAQGDYLVYKISGVIRPDILKSINYKGLVTNPYRHNLALSKQVLGRNYFPGKSLTYILKVQNNSSGNAGQIPLQDILSSIQVESSKGGSVPAFKPGSVTVEPSTVSGYGAFAPAPSDPENIDVLIDVPVGGYIEYRVSGVVDDTAVGGIVNKLIVDGDTVSAGANSPRDRLDISKSMGKYIDIDGVAGVPEGYVPGGYVEYFINLSNRGEGIIDNYPITDELSKIQTTLVDGSQGPAFISWEIVVDEDSGIATDIGDFNPTGDIKTNIDIGPNGYIKYKILAKINPKAVGSFSNQVNVNGVVRVTENSRMALPVIIHTKKVYDSTGSREITTYKPGDQIVYKISIKNVGLGTSYGVTYNDLLEGIKASEAGNMNKVNPFGNNWKVVSTTSGGITTVGTLPVKDNKNIESTDMIIAPRGEITFEISATIGDRIYGAIENNSVYGQDSQRATLQSAPGVLDFTNKVLTLRGQSFDPSMMYKPGDTVQYELVVKNTGDGFLPNILISDYIPGIVANMSGNINTAALKNINLNFEQTDPRTSVIARSGDSNDFIQKNIDLAPNSYVKILITGDIDDRALGQINGNIFLVNDGTKTSDVINPTPAVISGAKRLISPANAIYTPGDEINYKITVTNSGEGYGNDIPIADLLPLIDTEIVGSQTGKAFSSWTISYNGPTSSTDKYAQYTYLYRKTNDKNGLDATIDIGPGITVTFDIKANVALNAVGTIENVASIGNKTYRAPAINLKPADLNSIVVKKVPKNDKYSPNGALGFEIGITNRSDTTANDILLTDIISEIQTEQAGGNQGPAFQGGWTVSTSILGDTTNSAVLIPSGGDLQNSKIDLAKSSSVVISISGNASATSLGVIKNTASWTYNNSPKQEVSAVVNPNVGEVNIIKTANITSYAPGTEFNYMVEVRNTGIGYVNNGIIEDDLKSIEVELVDGSKGPAFTNVNIISQQGSSPHTKFGAIDTSLGYRQENADIYPGDTATIILEATVNPKAFGPIVNNASVEYEKNTKTSSLTLNTEPGILNTLKAVDRLNYTAKGSLNYTITLTNSGKGWLKDVTVVDKISEIITTTASGETEPAFSTATDIDETIDIAPGTSIELKGSGEVNDFASGEIKNSAKVNGSFTNEVESNPLITDLDLQVVADKVEYIVGNGNSPQDIHKITYTITLTNIGEAVANLELVDPIKEILVKDNFGDTIPAFKSWQVLKFEYPTGDNLSLNVPTNTETTINPVVKGALELNGKITLVVECIINETGDKAPVQDIINVPFLKQGDKINSATVSVVPSSGVLELTKVVSTQTYRPEDEITYTITLNNTGDGFIMNNALVDNIDNIVTELAGDSIGKAFDSWTWTVDSSSTRTVLIPGDFKADHSLNTSVTLAPKSQVVVSVKAVVGKLTLGDIPENTVTFGSATSKSKIVKSLPGEYSINKKIVSGIPFVPGGDIVYEIKISNTGEGYVNDLKIGDKIGEILAESVGGVEAKAFSKWIVYAEPYPTTAIIFGEKNYPNTTDIDDILDISPGSTAIFTVVATVADNIYGDIENIATAGTKTSNITAQGEKATLDFAKMPIKSTYSPGGSLGYILKINNTSSAIAGRVKLKDYITSLLVDTVGNSEFPFKDYTIKTIVTGDTVNTDMAVPTSGDIDITGDIGPKTSVEVLISGTAIDTAIGKVENSATLTYLNDITKTAVVEPDVGAILIEKTAVQPAYTPGQNVTYNIKITNTGSGYTSGVAIEDDLGSLGVFDLSSIKVAATSDSSLSEVENLTVKDGTLTAIANIHPNGWVNIQIDAKVLENIKDPINNTAFATYNGVSYDSTNSLNSVPGSLSIEKFQNQDNYIPQDEMIYTLELSNTGDGWLKEVALYDEMKNIQTQILGGSLGPAFVPETIKSKIVSQGKSTLQIIDDGNLLIKGDMAPQSKAVITIVGTTSDNTVGAIKNTARAVQNRVSYNSKEVVAIQDNPVLKLIKTGDNLNYEVGKPIKYTISLENNSVNNVSGVNLEDILSDIKVLNSKGVMVDAFKPGWKISYTAQNPGTIITSGTVKDGEDLNVQMDIHSFDTIIFTIEATVIDDAVGVIKNISNATVGTRNYSSSYESIPYDAAISSKKTSIGEKYSPGSVLTYNIDVENTGLGYADDIQVSDILSTIKVMTPTGEQNAFDMKDVKISIKRISPGVVTTIPSGVSGVDLSDSLDMPPGSSITYEITGIVNEFATGNITNIATVNGIQNTASVGSEDYALKVTANQNRIVYIPGEDVEFNLNIENVGLGLAVDVDVKEYITEGLARDVSGNIIQPFESWVVVPTTVGNQSSSGKTEPNKSIDTKIDIAPKGSVNYLVRARVKGEISGDILIDSVVTDSRVTTTRADETFKNVFKFIPPKPIIELSKTSDKENYIETDESIIYTLTIKNSGVGNVEGVEIKDIISGLKGKNGNPLFTEWKTTVVENGESANADLKVLDNQDVIGKVNLRSDGKNEIVYTITGKINKGLDDNITNIFMARDPITSKVIEASVTNHVKKIPDNEGELRVIKKAFKNEVKIGEAVEYEIIVENNNESRFIDVVLKDRIPSGFKYVKNTAEITMSGLDGIFKTNDDEILTGEPVVTSNGLSFPKFGMEPFTKYRVRYLLKPSVGVTFGKYVNSAYVDLNGSRISNIAHATVSIKADALLDTASIIGKVFEDKNGDGYQDKGELGIPGVRLITPKGIVIETDQFGRYHVPDEWVYSKNGKNYEVKLDETTLPKDMEVLSENPQIRRVSPYALTKFNFSVRYKDGKERVDKTRIYADKGAIWGVVDSAHVEPELILTIPKQIVVKNGALAENVSFTVRTNYGDFIKKYELQIFAQEDNTLSHPIMILSGDELYNDMDIDWNGQLLENKQLKVGQQLRFRLKVFSADGKFDMTKPGYTDLVSRKPEVELFNYENETEVGLQTQNIGINTGMVRFTGDGLKDVEKIYIGNDEYDVDQDRFMVSKYMPSANYTIPVKLVYEDNSEKMYELEMNVPETYYIQTGIADFSLGRNYISGNSEVLDVENPFGPEYYADNIYNEGRIAYYGRGKYKDKWRLTVQVDTKANSVDRLFNDILKRDEQTLFERVEDSENVYYPTYGDRAYIYNDAPTDGKIYLKLQYEKSSVMWGNYNTGFTGSKYTQYNRSLYGAKGSYASSETTEFGDEKNTLTGFASEPDSLYGHDEFLGTGGSLYFLRNGDVLNGSEKIWIKVVDSNTGLTSKIIYLEEGKDYEFDPYQGRIILAKPLSGNMSGASNGIIQNSVSGDNYVYLIADYEYIPKNNESINQTDYGFKGRTWMNDHVGVGGTYIKESKERTDYTLSGVDLTLKATEGTYFKGEVSRSEGVQTDNNFISYDGGLTFDKVGSGIDKISGNAYNFTGVLNLADLNPELFSPYGNDVRAWYEKKKKGYSFASELGDKEFESYGAEINLRNTDRIKSKLKYESMEERDLDGRLSGWIKSIGAQIEYLFTDRVVGGLAVQHVEELRDSNVGTGDLLGARVEYEIDEDTKVFTEGQVTLNKSEGYEKNDIITVGGEKKVTEKLTVDGKTSVGTRGNYTEVGADYNLMENYDVYLGYSMDGEEDSNKITAGQRAKVTDKISIYQENQFLNESKGKGSTESYGVDYELDEDISFGASFQLGKIDLPDDEGTSKRRAASIYSKVETAKLTLKNKLEYREEENENKIKQYLTTNSFNYVIDEEYTFAGKLNFAFTDDEYNAKFIESSIGLAYRPIYNDRLNFLSRYTVILDDDPRNDEDSRAYVVEFESIYSYTKRLDIGLKGAYRRERDQYVRESGDRLTVNNNIYLVGLKVNYMVMNDWEVYGQYHWLVDQEESDVASGAIVGIYKNMHKNLKFGGGYNFSGFSDNLGVDDYKAHGWFMNVIGRM